MRLGRLVPASAMLCGALVAVAACGSSGDTSTGGDDSGPGDSSARDVATGKDSAQEEAAASLEASSQGRDTEASTSSSDAGMDALPLICLIDADITELDLSDAGIGDAGLSVAGCYSCVTTMCGDEVRSCEGDCTCKTNVVGLVKCLAGGTSVTTCILALFGSSDSPTSSLLTCLLGSSCPAACGASGG